MQRTNIIIITIIKIIIATIIIVMIIISVGISFYPPPTWMQPTNASSIFHNFLLPCNPEADVLCCVPFFLSCNAVGCQECAVTLSFAKLRTCDSYQPEEKEESEEADAAIAVMVTFS